MPKCPVHGDVDQLFENEAGKVFCVRCWQEWLQHKTSHLQEDGFRTSHTGVLKMDELAEAITQYVLYKHDMEIDDATVSTFWKQDGDELALEYAVQVPATDKGATGAN